MTFLAILFITILLIGAVGTIWSSYLLLKGNGKETNLGTSKVHERDSPTIPPTIVHDEDDEDLSWASPPLPVISALNQKQVDNLKDNIQTQEDALTVSINEAFLSGQPVISNLGSDGKWTIKKVGEKK